MGAPIARAKMPQLPPYPSFWRPWLHLPKRKGLVTIQARVVNKFKSKKEACPQNAIENSFFTGRRTIETGDVLDVKNLYRI